MVALSIRKIVLERDNNSCQKCCRTEDLAIHHIIFKCDGGTDDPDNLLTLCTVCHEEWHSLETGSIISFDVWLKMPTLTIFIAAFMKEWSEEITAAQMKESIEFVHKLKKQERLLRRVIDERQAMTDVHS